MKTRHRLLILGLAALLPALAIAIGEPASPQARGPEPKISPLTLGAQMPAYTGRDIASAKQAAVSLSRFAGQPVLVNLWASWCGPCVSELPGLARLDESLGPRGLKLVGISLDDRFDDAEMVVGDLNLKYVNLYDVGQRALATWGVETLPASFLYNREGRLVWRKSGIIRFDDPSFVQALENVVGRPKTP